MSRKKAVVEVIEAPAVVTEEASSSEIVVQAQQVIADAAVVAETSTLPQDDSAIVDDGSNGKADAAPEASAPKPQVEEFSCKFGGHFKNADPWKFFTERIEFRGLLRTTVEDDMGLVRSGVVCKVHGNMIRNEAQARGEEAPWFFRLPDTLEKVEERESKRAELKAKAEAERLEMVAKRLAEQEATHVEVSSYLEELKVSRKRHDEKLKKERDDRRKRQDSFRRKEKYQYSGPHYFEDADNGKAPVRPF